MVENDVVIDIKRWISRNWTWLVFIGGITLLLLLDQNVRGPFFFVLFICPMGILIWNYWNKSYVENFKKLEQTKKSIDQRVQHLRTGKYAKMDFLMKLFDCNKDYATLEVRREMLKKQQERDVVIVISTILLMYCFILPIAIGFLGWHNIIDILS